MIDSNEMKMRIITHQWCKEDIPSDPDDIPRRRERIIQKIMNTFGVSREKAMHIFIHNNDLSD